MSKHEAIAILNEHGINWLDDGSWIVVNDIFTVDGKRNSFWIQCPKTVSHLMAWLGY